MPFDDPHILQVWFTVEVGSHLLTDTMVIETDLHLNSGHPDYDADVVDKLIQTARDYLAANRRHVTNVRIMSIRSDQIRTRAVWTRAVLCRGEAQ